MARLFAIVVGMVALVAVASGASLRASGRSRGCDEPEGSKVIKGPDCGQVSQIVPMYRNAGDVGGLAGAAQGAITNADASADNVKTEKDRAEEIASVLSEDDTEGVTLAAEDATKAAEKAAEASTALAIELETFKGSVSGKGRTDTKNYISGADITEDDKSALTKLTEEAVAATKACDEAGVRVVAKAQEAQAKAMKDTAKASKLIGVVLEKAEPLIEEIADVSQKSKHAADDMDAVIKKAEDQEQRLADTIEEAEEQTPVWDAMKVSIEKDRNFLIEDQSAVNDQVDPLTASADELSGKIDPLKDDAATIEGGGSAIMSKPKDIAAAQKAQDGAEAELLKMKAAVERMIEGSRKMEETITEAEEKLNWPAYVAHMKEMGTPIE
jgi:hypothetical protein